MGPGQLELVGALSHGVGALRTPPCWDPGVLRWKQQELQEPPRELRTVSGCRCVSGSEQKSLIFVQQ